MNHEKTVRDAALAFRDAIAAARKAGYAVTYPPTVDGLGGIAISETGKVALTVAVHAPEDVSAETTAKASAAAQKAADRVVDKANDRVVDKAATKA